MLSSSTGRTSFLIVVLLCITVGPEFAYAAKGPSSSQDAATAIRAVLDAQVAAWNRGDLDAYMNGYWRSPELTFYSGGSIAKGWDTTRDRYRKRYQGAGNEMGQLAFTELHIDMLAPNAAVVRGGWELTTESGKNPGGLFTLICRKFPEGWRIVHDHTSNR
jgi:ketosteroid isomerase-like protein